MMFYSSVDGTDQVIANFGEELAEMNYVLNRKFPKTTFFHIHEP